MESDVPRLKDSFEKAKSELAVSKKAQDDAEEKNSGLERRVSTLQNELETTRSTLEEKLRQKEKELADLRSRHHNEVENFKAILPSPMLKMRS